MSVYHAFEHVSDGRHQRGVRYSVALILTLIVLGKLTGMTTLTAIAEWVRWRADWLQVVLPTTRSEFPCVATYSNVLRAVEAEQVLEVIAHLLTRLEAQRRCGEEPSRLLKQPEGESHRHSALDGKTLRGTLSHLAADQLPLHVVALYEPQTGVVLQALAVGAKQNELSVVPTQLSPVLVNGRIITTDALHTQHGFCRAITRWGGEYVCIVKANQPTLEEDLRLFFSEPPADCRDWRQARSCSKGHGRLEVRELVASTELNDFLEPDWAGIAQVFRLSRTIQERGQTRHQVVYGLTSLAPCVASADRLLELVRAHWAIENRLHWRRDVTVGEDHCQVRKGKAPHVLVALNCVVLALLDFLRVRHVPRQMRSFGAHPQQVVRLLLGSLLTFPPPCG